MEVDTDESEMIPRLYQIDLEEQAAKKNTIIHLPTGSGKTFIAINLIKRMKSDIVAPLNEGGQRTIFLVNNVPLVEQQKAQLRRALPDSIEISCYSSEDRVDYWDEAKWRTELERYQILVMTAQIFLDMLLHDYVSLKMINLLIFDECHHAVDDHPMRRIMKNFEFCPADERPRVLGLTATLMNSNVKEDRVEDTIKELETTFHACIASVNHMGQVLSYSTNPKEILITFNPPGMISAADYAIRKILSIIPWISEVKLPVKETVRHLRPGQVNITQLANERKINKMCFNIFTDMTKHIQDLGLYGGSIGVLAHIIQLERIKNRAETPEAIVFYRTLITVATETRAILESAMSDVSGFERLKKYSTDHILAVLKILRKYSPNSRRHDDPVEVNTNGKELCSIIFTRERFMAKILFNILKLAKELNPDFEFLSPEYVVGVNLNPSNDTREQFFVKKMSESAVCRFKHGTVNCLVSTSILEEGIDVPQCSLIVRYDFPSEFRSYVQSKGRARNKESCFVLLMNKREEGSNKAMYNKFRSVEKIIDKVLNNGDGRDMPTELEIQKNLYEDVEIPPFIAPSGAMITETSAISLLNRYCSLLPRDQFTLLTPTWFKEDVGDAGYIVVTIIMPINCPVKEPINSLPMLSLKSAKRSAALSTCVALYKKGLFEEDKLVPKPYCKVEYNTDEMMALFPHWNYSDEKADEPKPGTKKRVRRHKLVLPKCLDGPTRDSGEFFIHILKLDTSFKKPSNSRDAALYEMLKMNEGYGLLTHSKLPRLCQFPLFLKVGEVQTELDVNYKCIQLNSSQLERIKRFHFMLFSEVLSVAKKFIAYEPSENFMLAVPVNKNLGSNYYIDWDIIQTYLSIEPIKEAPIHERMEIKLSKNHKYSVVTPWYRDQISPARYVVSNVLEYMTPYSCLSARTETFADYYESKYGLTLCHKDQPLLEVKNITSRMNCLLPRAETLKGLSPRQMKQACSTLGETSESYDEIFVPELCIMHEFPGVLWYKAMLLPSAIHRITLLLQADELRLMIQQNTRIGVGTLPKEHKWQPITLEEHVARNALLATCNLVQPEKPIDNVMSGERVRNDDAPTSCYINMKENLFKAKMQQLDKMYGWDASKEPIDIERNLTKVTLADIQCYDNFVMASISGDKIPPAKSRTPPKGFPAILPPPAKYKEKIAMLTLEKSLLGIELKDIAAALTLIKSNDIYNLERMETLGDAFLKFASTAFLYHAFPKLNEGQLTNIKCRLLGNRNLYHAGCSINLAGRMKVEQFSPRGDFLVPGFTAPKALCKQLENLNMQPTELLAVELNPEAVFSGKCNLKLSSTNNGGDLQSAYQIYTGHVVVSDKCVADCVEALLGGYLQSCGPKAAFVFLQWLQVIPRTLSYQSLLRKPSTVYTRGEATPQEIDALLNDYRKEIEAIIGYEFKDPSLLLEALSHSSYIRNRKTNSYERLEFLGDALLDFLITSYIYENYQTLKPGQLTDLRSALVNNVTFASYIVKLKLDKYMLSALNPTLIQAVQRFQEHQEQRNFEISADVLYLIDEEDCKMAECIEVPKVLSDLFESITGAIFLDTGGDFEKVWHVVYQIMYKEIEQFASDTPIQPVRMLLERQYACPEFFKAKPVSDDIPTMMVAVKVICNGKPVICHGFGSNKAEARRAAAKIALKTLGYS